MKKKEKLTTGPNSFGKFYPIVSKDRRLYFIKRIRGSILEHGGRIRDEKGTNGKISILILRKELDVVLMLQEIFTGDENINEIVFVTNLLTETIYHDVFK